MNLKKIGNIDDMITYIESGDIFKIDDVLNYAHGCNCSGAMGKGIAVQFKKKFPEMYKTYRNLCVEKKFNIGDVYIHNYGIGYVFNLGTQVSWRTNAELQAIEQSLEKMLLFASEHKIKKIALPKIGSGLGGLKWQDVKVVLEQVASQYSGITLFIVENFEDR
ncbi:O-acetyl-ADP-ribose deacetylase (regulator of RNase III) [Mucilaginibacter frigoritolerans]|uniref:O-acetyl-ADP-ribose deacetylase (Regulator of RNase III) n=1 Tax=Mucilaginibacter frigoritolerans TaxID=652788 RepID=A0A562TUB6_9SPHI|nr:macro domain-containing protein [Mucilaginibacter frigoritolerans]TWI96838.1 O-acetyl-ADP-ribose deacetylase (regulator of RNase III) [Mucilaginibacter frigoritolerans]